MLEVIHAESPDLARRANRLLGTLGDADFALLGPHLRNVELLQGTVLQEQEAPVEQVYFPLRGVVSLVSVLAGGEVIETATVGRDGAIGVFGGLGRWNAIARAIVRVPGAAAVVPVAHFQAAVRESDDIRNLILRYTEALLGQVQKTAACNALHPLEARLARWLLQTVDGAEDPSLPLTQELISQMLGVRRTTVTFVAGKLQQAGLIRCQRGRLVILNRVGLEEAACECYETLRRRTEAFLIERDGERAIERDGERAAGKVAAALPVSQLVH
jgi:CRP-like cAMP-binding protein